MKTWLHSVVMYCPFCPLHPTSLLVHLLLEQDLYSRFTHCIVLIIVLQPRFASGAFLILVCLTFRTPW